MELSEKLKALRKKHGFTQNELALKLFVTKQAVYKWEKGKNYPDIDNLIKIAEVYKVKVDDLLDKSVDLNSLKNKEGVFLVDYKSKENLKIYIRWLPIIGLISSIIAFVIIFGIIGVDDGYIWAILYCSLPVIVFTLLYIPLNIVMKREN